MAVGGDIGQHRLLGYPWGMTSERASIGSRARVPRRLSLALLAVVVTVGLVGRAVLPASVGGPLGDILYATMATVAVVLILPTIKSWPGSAPPSR